MVEFGLALLAIFSGVLGAAIGFFLIAATALLLALPYIMMNRPQKSGMGNQNNIPAKQNASASR